MNLKVNEVAAAVGETPNVIRNWLRDFKGQIPVVKAPNGYNMYPPDAVEVIRTIQRLHREQGYSVRQIEHYLVFGELAASAELTEPPAALSEDIAELNSKIEKILEQQEKQQEFNKVLLERLDQRDKLLTEYIIERRHEKKLLEQQKAAEKPSLIGRIKKIFENSN